MANKTIKTRIQCKHDTATNWANASGFIPLAGELIIYDKDATNPVRIKIGDGVTPVTQLPFFTDTFTLTSDGVLVHTAAFIQN